MTDRGRDFEATMRGLENGLRVEEIASFDLQTCAPGDDVVSVQRRMVSNGLDQLPVSDGVQIVGVLERFHDPTAASGTVQDAMKRLQESMLVSASDPIGTLLPLLRVSHYRLVVRRGGISGIVTRSDLIKLPVRLYAFAQITYLEMLMAARIAEDFRDSTAWMSLLSASRRQKVNDKICEAQSVRLDPSPLEFTDFCDKRDILRKHRKLGARFDKDLKEIEQLRNILAHAGDYGQSLDDLLAFMHRLDLAEIWIARLETSGEG